MTSLQSEMEARREALVSKLESTEMALGEWRLFREKMEQEAIAQHEALTQALKDKAGLEASLTHAREDLEKWQEKELSWNKEMEKLRQELVQFRQDHARLQAQQEETLRRLADQQEFVEQANTKLREAFRSLSAEALKMNNESFVSLAKSTLETKVSEAKSEFEKKRQAIDELVKPLSESLGKFDSKIQELEQVRLRQHGQINQYIEDVKNSTERLQRETQNLVSALKSSHTRGRYGEIGLRRVVEVAGMTEHCDFEEQVSVQTGDGRLRPDMIIRLPEQKSIVVDSKLPLAAYMRAFETEDPEERKALLAQHAAAVRDHLKALSEKAYWSQFEHSPDWVVFYMQIESAFGAALQADPALVEDAIRNRIIFATPTTLITLLRTVSFVWQQVRIAGNIEQIRDAGIELYNRTTVLLRHFANIGGSLRKAVSNYNEAVASLESRFIPQARKLHTLGSAFTKNTLPEADPVELNVRELSLPEEEIPGCPDPAENGLS